MIVRTSHLMPFDCGSANKVRMRVLPFRCVLPLIALAACAAGPGPGDPSYPFNLAGSYVGRFMFHGQPFDATLQLRTGSGGTVRGGFRIADPVVIDGLAEGVIIDDLLRLTVSYRSEDGCDSRVEGILTIERGGSTIDGPVTVTDCGEPVAGTMSFRRRERSPRSYE